MIALFALEHFSCKFLLFGKAFFVASTVISQACNLTTVFVIIWFIFVLMLLNWFDSLKVHAFTLSLVIIFVFT